MENANWQERLFGRQLIKCITLTKTNDFEISSTSNVLKNIEYTGIYFSFANIKLQRDEYTKKLQEFYERLNSDTSNDTQKFELVQVVLWANNDVYSDFEQSHTDSLLNLPWFAMPFSEIELKEGKSWITAIFTIHVVPKSPNLLAARIAGEFVPEIENCPDELIIRGIGYIFHKFLGKQHVPDKIIRENWYSNSHFHGAYSFQTVASQKRGSSQANILAQPLLTVDGKPTLLFAGEATHPKYYSTVHGAIQTGFREAERLIDFYK